MTESLSGHTLAITRLTAETQRLRRQATLNGLLAVAALSWLAWSQLLAGTPDELRAAASSSSPPMAAWASCCGPVPTPTPSS